MIRRIILIAVAALLFGGAAARAETIAYWHFDDGAPGSSAGTLATQYNSPTLNATASSPYPTFSSDLPRGGLPVTDQPNLTSLSLPVNDGGVRVAWATDNPLLQQNTFTIEAFIKTSMTTPPLAGWPGIVEKVPTPGGDTWSLGLGGNFAPFSRFDTTTNYNYAFSAGPSLNDGKWHHIALTYQYNSGPNNGSAIYYVDYAPAASATVPGALVHGLGLIIGGGGGGHNPYVGLIDEVRFSNVVLAPYQFLGVPEPAGAVLLVSGVLALLFWRRLGRRV